MTLRLVCSSCCCLKDSEERRTRRTDAQTVHSELLFSLGGLCRTCSFLFQAAVAHATSFQAAGTFPGVLQAFSRKYFSKGLRLHEGNRLRTLDEPRPPSDWTVGHVVFPRCVSSNNRKVFWHGCITFLFVYTDDISMKYDQRQAGGQGEEGEANNKQWSVTCAVWEL